jgi:hypothetical protein
MTTSQVLLLFLIQVITSIIAYHAGRLTERRRLLDKEN